MEKNGMEKRAVVEPGRTPEEGEDSKVKKASTKEAQVEALDDDFTKRAADKAADTLK